MENNQYYADSERLAELLEYYTEIPRQKTLDFINEYGVSKLLPCANMLCTSEEQKRKLEKVFEFKNIYEQAKQGDSDKSYVINDSIKAMEYFCNYFADKADKEYFVVTYLNTVAETISTKTMFEGTLTGVPVYERNILKEALNLNAKSIITAHNHPSGNLVFSADDYRAWNNLLVAFEGTGVNCHDFLIISENRAASIKTPSVIHCVSSQPTLKPEQSEQIVLKQESGSSTKEVQLREDVVENKPDRHRSELAEKVARFTERTKKVKGREF